MWLRWRVVYSESISHFQSKYNRLNLRSMRGLLHVRKSMSQSRYSNVPDVQKFQSRIESRLVLRFVFTKLTAFEITVKKK